MSESIVLEDADGIASPTREFNPRAFIKSFGCQMNVYDAERMGDLAAEAGYREAARVEDADLIVLNTCHIRERASEKIYSELGKLRELKEERGRAGRRTMLVVAGCVAQAEGCGNPAPPAGGRHRRRPAELSSPAAASPPGARPAWRRGHRFSGRGQVLKASRAPARRDSPARRRRLRHRAGRLRQVLFVLRRALHPRGRGLAAGGCNPRRDRASSRSRRPRGDVARPERQRLSWAQPPGPSDWPRWINSRRSGHAGHLPRALYDLAPQRHER